MSLFPVLRLCFPDLVFEAYNQDVRDTCISELMGALATRAKEQTIIDVIHCLSVVAGALRNAGALLPEGVCRANNLPGIVVLSDCNHQMLTSTVESLLGSVPMPSQLLWCSHSTTAAHITRFLFAAKMLPWIRFGIVRVNELSAESREMLLNEISKASVESAGKQQLRSIGDNVFLIFTGQQLAVVCILVDCAQARLDWIHFQGSRRYLSLVHPLMSSPSISRKEWFPDRWSSFVALRVAVKALTLDDNLRLQGSKLRVML